MAKMIKFEDKNYLILFDRSHNGVYTRETKTPIRVMMEAKVSNLSSSSMVQFVLE